LPVNFRLRHEWRGTFSCLPGKFCTFLCAAKEKYQKKGGPDGLPANAGFLRFSVVGAPPPVPLHSPSTVANPGTGAHPVRGKDYEVGIYAALIILRVVRAPGLVRNAGQGCGAALYIQADEGAGCPSLWVLSPGQTRESTSPDWAKTKAYFGPKNRASSLTVSAASSVAISSKTTSLLRASRSASSARNRTGNSRTPPEST
jgi:hypothetical protein